MYCLPHKGLSSSPWPHRSMCAADGRCSILLHLRVPRQRPQTGSHTPHWQVLSYPYTRWVLLAFNQSSVLLNCTFSFKGSCLSKICLQEVWCSGMLTSFYFNTKNRSCALANTYTTHPTSQMCTPSYPLREDFHITHHCPNIWGTKSVGVHSIALLTLSI